jgi:GTPase SAR1 family protein
MFYENAEFQLALFHVKNKNNNAFIESQSHRKQDAFFINNQQKQLILNIILIGDKNIGKSNLIKQFTQHIFPRKKSFTNRENSLDIMYNEQRLHLKFHSIDLSYQNDNNLISDCLLADCILFVYDISNQISFNHLIDRSLPLIENYRSEHICSYSLIGIKHKNTRQVTYHQLEMVANNLKLFYYEITSRSNYEEFLKEILDSYFQIRSFIKRLNN